MTLTIGIIVVTTVFSLLALYVQPGYMEWGMLRPYRTVREKSWYELLTSGFLHANIGHLLVNMFVLFFFGAVLEQTLNPVYYLTLYVSGILVSSVPSLIKFRDDPGYATIGASGAVESVLFAFIFLYPAEEIFLILIPIPIPAWLFGLLFLGYSIYESKRRRGRVNHEAHIAGALWGVLYLLLFLPGSLDHFLAAFGW